jgi:hypothetical protein
MLVPMGIWTELNGLDTPEILISCQRHGIVGSEVAMTLYGNMRPQATSLEARLSIPSEILHQKMNEMTLPGAPSMMEAFYDSMML